MQLSNSLSIVYLISS